MKKFEYTYNYEPEMYKYILSTNILNRKKHEDKIFKALVRGYSAKEIGKKYNYAESTIWNRRRDIMVIVLMENMEEETMEDVDMI